MIKVCHLSSVHSRTDTRIFSKECASLAAAGYETMYVVADGKGDESVSGIKILDAGPRPASRILRMTKTAIQVARRARALNADIYHLHDPELIPYVSYLRRRRSRVVYDAHEDLKRQLLSKPYLNPSIAEILSILVEVLEKSALSNFDAVITATPSIQKNLPPGMKKRSTTVSNFPWMNELVREIKGRSREPLLCFVGGISRIRGIKNMVYAMEGLSARLALGGEFESESLRSEIRQLPGWGNVDELGFIDRESVATLMNRAAIGLLLFDSVPNHVEAFPNKLFEYMSASLPVIASNFPLWREIVEGSECGICVDPNDVPAIRKAILSLLKNEQEARRMGENGRKAIEDIYNWEKERNKLLAVYETLI